MAHKEQREFCQKVKEKFPYYFKNKKVLDIGSLDINGSNKYLFEDCSYIGLDLGEGKNVDVISSGHLYDAPDNYFDTIISTEAFEHDMHYERTITNIIRMLKPGGLFLFTCAAPGRPEHGTRRTGGFDAPLLIQQSEEWADYYKNLESKDIEKSEGFKNAFPDPYFELRNTNIEIPADLYFYGIKGGLKYLSDSIVPDYLKEQFPDDIFVIDCWIDNNDKENNLINLIKRLKLFNIPILLTGHYPVKPEIQKMVDYYLFDKKNSLLLRGQFGEYGVNSTRWTDLGDVRVENHREYHHDYAIWETMRNAFNFCKFLGKQHIHFMEYDNLPNVVQYRQTFIENLHKNLNAVLYEYSKGSSLEKDPYVATYIFSIKTDIAVQVIDLIKTKEEFFKNKPDNWQLEKNFYQSLRKITQNTYICEYVPNDNELNTQAAWNRDGVDRNGANIQLYLAVDTNDDLYLHTISGNHNTSVDEDYLIEMTYKSNKKFYDVKRNEFRIHNIGKYHKGETVRVYHQGIEIFNEFLGDDVNNFRSINKLIRKNMPVSKPRELNVNFIDGPFVEIKEEKEQLYNIQFINKKNNQIVYELNLKSNHWARASKKYYMDWKIKITGIDNDLHLEHDLNLENNRVLISFESKSLGDTLAWMPYVEKFRLDRKCDIICSTFHNNLFKDQYLDIEFIEPGGTVNNIHALYRLGVFFTDGKVDYDKHFLDPKREPLTKVASDILGIDYVEIKPKLPVFTTKKKKLVSIAVHGTAQCKYWNNPTGWQEVVDFLVEKGYEVKLLSREEDGYMGNKNPKHITHQRAGKIENVLRTIQESELFIGISSGLAWLAWGAGTETILISGFTDVFTEPSDGVRRIINKDVCNSCWSDHVFNPGDWNWCPVQKGTDRQFECSKTITGEQVIREIKLALNL